MSAQPALFPDPAVRSSTARAPRGWRALPQVERVVELTEPGVTGRRKLTFRYRQLAAWSDDLVREAERLIGLYFQHFGGFRLADQAVLRAWVEALENYTAEEIRWALRAKWQSLQSANAEERRDKRKYVARPDKFPQTIGHWLQQAPEFQERSHRAQEAETRRRIDALNAARTAGPDPVPAATAQAARVQRAADLERERSAFWDGLTDAQRLAATRATESLFRQQCANHGTNPEDPQLDDLRRHLAINWARMKWAQPSVHHSAPLCTTGDGAPQVKP